MFNIVLLFILFLHAAPSVFARFVSSDMDWHVWHICILIIAVIQSLIIYLPLPFRDCTLGKKFTKIFAGVIMVASLWFLIDYMIITNVELLVEKYSG